MIRKVFLLVFDTNDSIDYESLHKRIIGLKTVTNWWHHLSTCYILISTQTAFYLSDEIRKVMPNKKFILSEIKTDEGSYDGWLPEDAWNWIKKQNILTKGRRLP